MMDAVEYLKEKERAVNCNGKCSKCIFSSDNNGIGCWCGKLETEYPERAVAIVEKWAAENPIKTRQSEFLKMFPNALKDGGVLVVRPCNLEGTTNMLCESKIITCEDCKREYWLTEVE